MILGSRGVQEFSQVVMNLKKLGVRVFWREQAFTTLESSRSGAILGFWDNAPIGLQAWPPSLSAINEQEIYIDTRRRACLDVIQYHISYLFRVW
jgi:hypothetical protein